MRMVDLARIKYNAYALWYNCDDEELKRKYKEILQAIEYAEDLKKTLRHISKLGADLY